MKIGLRKRKMKKKSSIKMHTLSHCMWRLRIQDVFMHIPSIGTLESIFTQLLFKSFWIGFEWKWAVYIWILLNVSQSNRTKNFISICVIICFFLFLSDVTHILHCIQELFSFIDLCWLVDLSTLINVLCNLGSFATVSQNDEVWPKKMKIFFFADSC